jgi:hypothetical protein
MRLNKVTVVTILSFLVIATAVFAASENYYARTDVYFNIPYDAAFTIAMPSTYDFPDKVVVTGLSFGDATATSPSWISFNFTQTPQSWIEPFAGGLSGDNQAGTSRPIFRYDPTGNTAIRLSLNMSGSYPTDITVYANGTCDDTTPANCNTPLTTATLLTVNTEITLVNSLSTNNFFNITLWGTAGINAPVGQSGPMILYHHSTRA